MTFDVVSLVREGLVWLSVWYLMNLPMISTIVELDRGKDRTFSNAVMSTHFLNLYITFVYTRYYHHVKESCRTTTTITVNQESKVLARLRAHKLCHKHLRWTATGYEARPFLPEPAAGLDHNRVILDHDQNWLPYQSISRWPTVWVCLVKFSTR